MANHGTRVQLCGKLVARIDGRRVDADLPGRQGRLAFAYLTLNRHRVVTRSALVDAIWPAEPPALVDTALSALISKLRKALGPDAVSGRGDVRLVLSRRLGGRRGCRPRPFTGRRVRSGRGAWAEAWGPGRVALHVVRREFMPGESAAWVDEERRALEEIELRALECIAKSSLELGPNELESAVRSGRDLVRLAPHRESGYRVLMRALAAEGNDAEALGVYERLRVRLREDLGVAPSAPTQELHRALLG